MMALEPRARRSVDAVAAARGGDCGALMLWQFFMAGIDWAGRWRAAQAAGRRGGWLGDGGSQAVGSQAGRAERS